MKLKPGKYFVGDPCYVKPNDHYWLDFCDSTEYFERDGVTIASAGTAFGDGIYNDQEGRSYCVDSGLIGATSLDHITDKDVLNHLDDLGVVADFSEPFEVISDGGVIQVGHIRIDTIGDDEDEDDLDDDDEWDEDDDDDLDDDDKWYDED